MNFPTHIVSVGALIENDEGKILMIKEPKRGWEFPGGQVEIGENLTEALKREVKEETGIDIAIGNLTTINSNIGIGVQYDGVSPIPTIVSFGFNGKSISGELTTSEESLEVKWFERDEVLNLIEEEFTRDKVKLMMNYNGRVTYSVFSRNPYILHEVQCF